MKRFTDRFNRASITKQYLILLVCSFLVVLLLSLLILFQARQAVIHTGNEFSSMFSSTLSTELSSQSAQAVSICEQLFYNDAVISLLEAKEWSKVDVKKLSEIRTQKIYLSEASPYIADISFFSSLIHWSSLYDEETLSEMAVSAADARSAVCLGLRYATLVNSEDTPYLVFCAPVYSRYQPTGNIFVSIHLPQISVPTDWRDTTSAAFLMVDEQYHTYPFNCEHSLADEIIRESNLKEEFFLPDTPVFRTNIILKKHIVSYQYVKSANCYIISAVDTDRLTWQLRGINLLCITMIVATVFLLTGVYFSLYRNCILPIRNLDRIIKEMEANNQRTIREPLDLQGCGEIQQIKDSFASLLTSVNELNRQIIRNANDLYEAELQQKTAELNYLRSQINPHFIYNTLELMRGIAADHNVPQIGQISVSMGKILRYSITGEHIVPLQREITMAFAYLHIQQARFPNRFTVLTNFQPDTVHIPVIKMLLQPLIENAIFHGLEPKEGNGTLFLSSVRNGEILKITVRDNGVGIPAEKLSDIQYSLNSPIYDTSRNIGLVNTNARLHLQYGPDYGICVESMEGDGTCVTLELPSGELLPEDISGSLSQI